MNFFKIVIEVIKTIFIGIYRNIHEMLNDITSETGIREKNLESFLAEKGLSELLKYRDYYEEDGKDCGIYHMSDNSKAIILRITAPAYVSEKTEGKLSDFFSSININDTVVQFITFASRNIEKHLKKYEDFHTGNTVNVDNPRILQDMVRKRISELRRWTTESMSNGVDFRIKDFHNLLVVLFPENIENDAIYKKYDEILGSLPEFQPRNYHADDLLAIISEMLYFDKNPEFWNNSYDPKMEMNHQIVSGGVKLTTKKDFKGFKSNNKVHYRVLTTKSFPRDLSLFDYNNAFFDKMGQTVRIPISTSFLISLTLRFDNVKKRKDEALGKLNHDIGELSKLRPLDLKKRPDLKERLQETENNIYLLREENEIPVKGMWTLTIMDESEKRLNEQCSAIKQKLSDLGWDVIEEASNNIALMTFLYSLPAQFSRVVEDTSRRFRILFKSNHASMAPIMGDSLGVGDYNILTPGRSGQIQRFDPFAKGAAENPNIIKAGGSGSGKSFSESEFQSSSISAGYLVRVIDAGGSYETLCKSIGGQYIDFEENSNLSLNFFSKARTVIDDKNKLVLHPDEVSSITSFIGLMGGVNLTHEYKASGDVENVTKIGVFTETIMKAVNIAFERAAFSSKLEDVRDIIIELSKSHKAQERSISNDLDNFASSLYRYADANGPFYKYFNPPNNVDLKKDYVVIETQSLLNLSNDLFVVVVAILTNQIKNEFFSKDLLEKRKILTVDEAKPILDNKISLELLIQIYRKIRKYNGLANTITQSINDFFANDDVKVLYEIAGWRWFLKQNDGVINDAYSSGKLSVSRFEKRLLESIRNNPPNYSEYYITSENVTMLSRLKVDALTYWIYSTDPSDKAKVSVLMKKYNITETESRFALSLTTEGENLDTAIKMAKSNKLFHMDSSKILSLCENLVSKAIANESIIDIMSLDVVNIESKDIVFTELFTDITNDDGITNRHIYQNRDNILKMEEYDITVLKKLLNYISTRNGVYSINISLETLHNNSLVATLKSFANQFDGIEKRTIIELPLANLDSLNGEIISNIISEIQSTGYRIINDNLNNGDRILNVLTYNVDFIKLSPEVYSNSEENLKSEITLSALKSISLKKNINVIATMVSTKEEFEAVSNIDYIKYAQGFYISDRKQGR